MKPKIIKNKTEYEVALTRIEQLMNAHAGTDEGNELELLATLVEAYEREHYPIPLPDPITAIKFRMDQQGLKPKDLIPYIGSRSKVSEVLSRKRKLSSNMMRALHKGLGIPAEILLGEPGKILPEHVEEIDGDRFPVKEMFKRGWFEEFKGSLADAGRQAEELIRQMMISVGIQKVQPALLRCHVRSGSKLDDYALLAWRMRVLTLAKKEKLPVSYDQSIGDRSFFEEIIRLSVLDEGPRLAREFLGKHGIHLVILPHLPKTHLDGAAMMYEGTPVIALTLRHDRLDNFWFTLVHELAHLHLHIKKHDSDTFIDDLDTGRPDKVEQEADKLASEALIGKAEWSKWSGRRRPTAGLIIQFARHCRRDPSIVAGRIRHDKNNYQIFSGLVGNLKVKMLLVSSSISS